MSWEKIRDKKKASGADVKTLNVEEYNRRYVSKEGAFPHRSKLDSLTLERQIADLTKEVWDE